MSGQEDLQPEQYEAVLRYMEAANIEDYDTAVIIMRENQFNFHVLIPSFRMPWTEDMERWDKLHKWWTNLWFDNNKMENRNWNNTFNFW